MNDDKIQTNYDNFTTYAKYQISMLSSKIKLVTISQQNIHKGKSGFVF